MRASLAVPAVINAAQQKRGPAERCALLLLSADGHRRRATGGASGGPSAKKVPGKPPGDTSASARVGSSLREGIPARGFRLQVNTELSHGDRVVVVKIGRLFVGKAGKIGPASIVRARDSFVNYGTKNRVCSISETVNLSALRDNNTAHASVANIGS